MLKNGQKMAIIVHKKNEIVSKWFLNFPLTKCILTLTGFIQHETQNSKVAQHPVEFLQSAQLYFKLEVELVSQHPLESKSTLLQTKPAIEF